MAAINQAVVDVQLAKRTVQGMVAFSADITLLVPTDRSKINGSLIYEFNNRGAMLLPYVDAETDALFSRGFVVVSTCLLYTSPSPRDATLSRMPSSA